MNLLLAEIVSDDNSCRGRGRGSCGRSQRRASGGSRGGGLRSGRGGRPLKSRDKRPHWHRRPPVPQQARLHGGCHQALAQNWKY